MSYSQLINDLVANGVLKTDSIIAAFHKIDRSDFVLPEDRHQADIDAPLSIGHEATISQPTTVAIMIELLQPQAGDKVLDIGSGSGWSAALLSVCVGQQGQVFGLERIEELVTLAQANIRKIKLKNIKLIHGDGYQGLPALAPFNNIHVAAAVKEIPSKLIDQLADNGRMVLPVGHNIDNDIRSHRRKLNILLGDESLQDVVLLKKRSGKLIEERIPGFQFVPLVK
ncbi:protein-L-isoaspartate O-methyltransferase [Patescibacteria group bacterium]